MIRRCALAKSALARFWVPPEFPVIPPNGWNYIPEEK